ncbi:MAG: hypothetical protein IKF31_07775 [Clostridiales bacterium]|nr:hypothetical protein [Clostridiales bacterium]
MKKLSVKAVSLILAASMLGSMAACKKKDKDINNNDTSHSGQKITEDTPWYNYRVIDAKIDLDKSREIDYAYQRIGGTDENNIIILTSGYYKMPEDPNIDWETFDYSGYTINFITMIDRKTGDTAKTIDLTDLINFDDYVDDISFENGLIKLRVESYDRDTYEQTLNEVFIDPSTEKIVDTKPVSSDGNIERSFVIGDYKVDTEMLWTERSSAYNIYITYPNGETKKVELKDDNKDYYDIPNVFKMDEKTALVAVSTDGEYIFFKLDLETGNLTPEDAKEYEWLDLERCYGSIVGSDGNVYYSSPTGISKIDFENKTCSIVFNYSWSSANRSAVTYLTLAEATEDSFLLCGDKYSDYIYTRDEYDSTFSIIEFTKADKNPNAGKYILELYSLYGYTDDKISDAILKFNESSSEYFIEVSDRYSKFDDTDYSNINSDDDYQGVQLEADAAMSSQLAMDILNGEGPDILMNCSSYGQLNSDSYLVDLTPYIGNLDSNKYFTNIVDSSKVDGKLYNLPICFEVVGIHTDAKYAGASGVGFTTEEYENFLNNTLNGKDVITSGQAYYFAKLYNAMSDKFISNGKIDFSGADFEAIAEFVKNNVPEKARSWDYYDDLNYAEGYTGGVGATIMKGDMPLDMSQPAGFTYCYGMTSYFTSIYEYNGATSILGLPSSDGRGPLVAPYISVAISAQAYNVDACGEFVKMLMSDEVQLDLAMKDNFVLSREAFREGGKAAVDFFNGRGFDDYVGYMDNVKKITLTEKNVDDMENIVLSCSSCNAADAAINIILIEEMPAYFSGQKPLSEVVAVAQDRAQKVLDERG